MAIIIPALPYTLTNGTTADANQVMADLNDIVSGVNTNAAHNGPNSDITALTGLTTPLAASQGGTGVAAPGPAGNMLTSNGGIWQSVAPGPGLRGDPSTGLVGLAAIIPPGGRLTLTSGVPVMTADVAAATTIYYTPYNGNNVPVYNGTVFVPFAFAELSLALNATAHLANTNYDLFVWNNAGTPQLVSGPAWSSATARASALALLSGIQTNAASMAGIASGNTAVTVPVNQGTYVGTFRTLAVAGQTQIMMNPAPASGGNAPSIYLWNMYNRRLMRAMCIDNGATYTYTLLTPRAARGSGANGVSFVTGLAEDAPFFEYMAATNVLNVAAAYAIAGFGLDVAAFSENANTLMQNVAASTFGTRLILPHYFAPQIGYHVCYAMEGSDGTHASLFDAGGNNYLSAALWC
jgi:hypothetical protein